MKIAVMIPVTNQVPPHQLKEAVDCWEKQSRKPDEIIVVHWDSLSNKEPLFSEGRCCNVALNRTKADYLAFTNVDIRPAHNVMEIIEEFLNKELNQILQCARLDLPEESADVRVDWTDEAIFDEWARKGKPHPAPGSLQVISTAWLRKVNGFDERYYGWGYYDCEIVRRAAMDHIDMAWIDHKATILHIWHPRSRTRDNEKANEIIFNGPIELIANQGKEWGRE